MSRNLAGVYSLPPIYEATSGDTILAEQHNTPLEDLEQDANTERPVVAGGTGVDTALKAWDVFCAAGADVASASTLVLSTTTGAVVNVSGTTTITAVTLGAGKTRIVKATGAWSLTASSSLVVNGSTDTDLTVSAGDLLMFIGETGKVRVWKISPSAPPDLSSYATLSGAETLTNKRVTLRIGSTTSSATPTPDADANDQYEVTALAAAATIGAPTGTPTDGQKMVIRIKDAGTAKGLTWNAIWRAIGVTLPTTTVISKTLYLGAIYNAADTKWDVVAVAQQA